MPGDGGDGGAVRCLPDAVDCDDTPGADEPGPADDGDAMVPEEITIVDAVPTDTRDVTVTFSGGETPCFVVDHVETDESDERVIVSVLVGMPDPDADCSQQEISTQSVSLQLDEPLGDRPLKDGSRTVPDDAQA